MLLKRAMMEKGLKMDVKKQRLLSGKFLIFHACYVVEEWKKTPFYPSNVTVGYIKDVLQKENA